MLFKATNTLVFLLCGWLIDRLSRHLGQFSQIGANSYLFLWHPLLLLNHLANAHNDVLMACCALLALWALLARLPVMALPVLLVGGLIKYAVLVAVPGVVLYCFRQFGAWMTAWALLAGGLTVWALAAPYVQGPLQWGAMKENAEIVRGSLMGVIYHPYRYLAQAVPVLEPTVPWLRAGLSWGFFGVFGVACWVFWRRVQPHLHAPGPGLVLQLLCPTAALALLVNSKFYPWYLGMFFPLVCLLPLGHPLRRLLVVVSAVQLLSMTFIGFAHIIDFLVPAALAMALWAYRPELAPTAPAQKPSWATN